MSLGSVEALERKTLAREVETPGTASDAPTPGCSTGPDKPPARASRPVQAGSGSVYAELRRLFGPRGRWDLKRPLLLLLIGIVVVLIGNNIMQVRLNAWSGAFFEAIDFRGIGTFGHQLIVFLKIVAVLLALVVAQTFMQELMKVRLRAYLTHRLLDYWFAPGRAYRLAIASELGINPDQRMQEDVRVTTEATVELGVGILQASMLLLSFVGVLWVLSAQVSFNIMGQTIAIPGYMVWCAIAYAALGSALTLWVGRPMIRLNAQRYAREGELRFALVRASENAESIALYGGEQDELRHVESTLTPVLLAMRQLSGALSKLTWITSGYGWLAIVVPILVASPGYFNGDLSLGGLMMVVGAFNQVQSSLRWFVDHFARIADWRAALGRVAQFCEAVDESDDVEATDRLELEPHPEGMLAFRNVSVALADGSIVIREATAEIRPGERVLIVGPSGSGKSTMMRAIAGLWPWGSGQILYPPRESTMFMPQRPYLPLGTLRRAVCYPAAPDTMDTADIEAALDRVALPELKPLLDVEDRWDRTLSVGQQQRLAFARLLLHRPTWIFMDEATAALDEANQANVMSIFYDELKDSALVSIGHRPGLEAFHNRSLELVHAPSGAWLRPKTHRRPADPTLLDDVLTLLASRFAGDTPPDEPRPEPPGGGRRSPIPPSP